MSLLFDTEMMRDKIKEMGESANTAGGTVALPGRHCSVVSVLRADLYSKSFYLLTV